MKKFNEKKTIKTLQEAEVNIRVREVYRKHQITEQIFLLAEQIREQDMYPNI